MTLEAVPVRLRLVLVRILRVSSGMGKPGMLVLNGPSASIGENWEKSVLRDEGMSISGIYDGISEITGVMETRGGAGRRTAAKDPGRSRTYGGRETVGLVDGTRACSVWLIEDLG